MSQKGKEPNRNHGKAREVCISSITIDEASRTRSARPEAVLGLAETIQAVGLLHPPVVDKNLRVLAGGHRVAALEILSAGTSEKQLAAWDARFPHRKKGISKSVQKRLAALDPAFFDSHHIPVYQLDFDADDDPNRARAVEIAENERRKNYSHEEIRSIAKKLEAAGYSVGPGRPKAGEKAVGPALQDICGSSYKTIQRALAGLVLILAGWSRVDAQAGEPISLHGGHVHVTATKADGTVWTWGYGVNGQLGRAGNPLVPGQVGLTSAVVGVDAGSAHVLVLHSDGTLSGWGNNFAGQLGTGASATQPSPVPVIGVQNAVAVAAGNSASFAILADGTVMAWGEHQYLGLGPSSGMSALYTPQATYLPPGIKCLSASNHGLAVDTGGHVYSWGLNAFGQLGQGHFLPTVYPYPVSSLPANIVQVATGETHSLALDDTGRLYAWGGGAHGQLGTGTTVDASYPQWVTGAPSGITHISVGQGHSIARTISGAVWVWGDNSKGQLGLTGGDRLVPTLVPGLPHITHVGAARGNFTFVRTWDGDLYCWGDNTLGEMGNGQTGGTYSIHMMSGLQLLPTLRLAAPSSALVGSVIPLSMITVPAIPGSPYYLDVSLSGASPGVIVRGSVFSIPLNPPFLFFEYGFLAPSVFAGFVGTLDASGAGAASLYIPPDPILVGLQFSGACVLLNLSDGSLRISNGTHTVLN